MCKSVSVCKSVSAYSVCMSKCKSTVVCKACLYVWACLYIKRSVSILPPVPPSFHLSSFSLSISSYVPTFHNMSAPCLFIASIMVYCYTFASCYKIFLLHLSLCSSTLSGHPSSSFVRPFLSWGLCIPSFFPRASERRVLLIVGVCFSHLQTSSHLLIFTSSHLHIFSSTHLRIFSSSHLHISISSHLHIFSSSHLLILASSHLHISASPHLHIFTPSHLLIFSSALHIFTSYIFTSSHLLSLALLPSCPLALFSLLLFLFLS